MNSVHICFLLDAAPRAALVLGCIGEANLLVQKKLVIIVQHKISCLCRIRI